MSLILANTLQKMSSKSLLLLSCWRLEFQVLHIISSAVNKGRNYVHFHRFYEMRLSRWFNVLLYLLMQAKLKFVSEYAIFESRGRYEKVRS